NLESETLKSSLHHAQRMIQSLKNTIHRDKAEKMELRRMLQEARDEVEHARRRDTLPGMPGAGWAGAGGSFSGAASLRRPKSRSIVFRKPPKSLLGKSRRAETEVEILGHPDADADWEDHPGDASGSGEDQTAAAGASTNRSGNASAAAGAAGPGKTAAPTTTGGPPPAKMLKTSHGRGGLARSAAAQAKAKAANRRSRSMFVPVAPPASTLAVASAAGLVESLNYKFQYDYDSISPRQTLRGTAASRATLPPLQTSNLNPASASASVSAAGHGAQIQPQPQTRSSSQRTVQTPGAAPAPAPASARAAATTASATETETDDTDAFETATEHEHDHSGTDTGRRGLDTETETETATETEGFHTGVEGFDSDDSSDTIGAGTETEKEGHATITTPGTPSRLRRGKRGARAGLAQPFRMKQSASANTLRRNHKMNGSIDSFMSTASTTTEEGGEEDSSSLAAHTPRRPPTGSVSAGSATRSLPRSRAASVAQQHHPTSSPWLAVTTLLT
ncbi:hypothetical protein KEM52_003343, partial [Ascosphaera acerosa]